MIDPEEKTAIEHRCDTCGVEHSTVVYCIEPYLYDIEGRELWVWLCPSCYQESCNDI